MKVIKKTKLEKKEKVGDVINAGPFNNFLVGPNMIVTHNSIDEACFLEVVEDSKKADGVDEKYDAAEDIHNAMMNRMTSRFMKDGVMPCLMCMISSPRFPEDFLERKIRDAVELGDISGIFWKRRPTWSAKGPLYYPSKDYFYIDTESYDIIEEEEALRSLKYTPIEEGERILTSKVGIEDPARVPGEVLYDVRKKIISGCDDPWDHQVEIEAKNIVAGIEGLNPMPLEPCPARGRIHCEIKEGQYKFVQKVKKPEEALHQFKERLVSLGKITGNNGSKSS